MLPCTASSEAASATRMAACRVSNVDQRFARSTSSTLSPQLNAASSSAGEDRQQHHVSPFHIGPPTDFSPRPTLGANHSFLSASVHRVPDDQPLDLTGGAGRKRRGDGSPNPTAVDVDSPLDLSVKRSRKDDAAAPLSGFSVLGVDHTVAGGIRGGLAMCGGGVVGHSPLRSVHVARSPVPLAQLHAAGQQVPSEDAPRLGVGAGAVPVIRRISSTPSRGSRICGEHPRPSLGISRMINDGSRLPGARHARDITVVVNGHRPEVLVGTGTKGLSTGSRGSVVRPAFTRIDYAGDRRGIDANLPGRLAYPGKAYDRGGITVLSGRSPNEPLVAASPTSVSSLSVCSAYITPPPPPVRPNVMHRSSLTSAARRSKVFPTLAPFPESSGSLIASHRVTLVDRLDPTETRPSSTFLPSNIVASASTSDLDGGGLYFGDSQSSTVTENSGEQLRGGLIWNTLTTDVADSGHATSTKSGERTSAFAVGGLSTTDKCSSDAEVIDRISSGDCGSAIVTERNFAVTQMVDFVERQQRAPLSGTSSTSGGSLLGHMSGATRRVPVANVHPIMKNPTKTATVAAPPSSTSAELPGPGRLLPPSDDETCSQLSAGTTTTMSSGRQSEVPAPAKDVTARLYAGLSRGGRVSSHHMEYVKFLTQNADDTASVASPSVSNGTPGQPRAVRGQQTVERRRGSTRGGPACHSAKVRRQLLPSFHHDQANNDQRQPAQSVPDNAATIATYSSKLATTESKNAVIAVSSSSVEHSSSPPSGTTSVSVGRKTTPIVYFDDDETTETPSTTTLIAGSHPTVKHWRQSTQGPSAARKQSAKLRKTARAASNTEATPSLPEAAGDKPSGTLKRRKLLTDVKTEHVDDGAAGDDDLTDFEDVQPSTSAQVCFFAEI